MSIQRLCQVKTLIKILDQLLHVFCNHQISYMLDTVSSNGESWPTLILTGCEEVCNVMENAIFAVSRHLLQPIWRHNTQQQYVRGSKLGYNYSTMNSHTPMKTIFCMKIVSGCLRFKIFLWMPDYKDHMSALDCHQANVSGFDLIHPSINNVKRLMLSLDSIIFIISNHVN